MRFTRDFYIPKQDRVMEKIERPELSAVVFLLNYKIDENDNLVEKPEALGFSGKASKPDFHFKFQTPERRNQYVDEYFKRLEASRKYKEERKAGKKLRTAQFLEELKPGVILYDTWGYDQTNVEFYKVLQRNGSKVLIQELGCDSIEGSEGFMCDRVVPGGPLEDRKPEWKVVRGESIKISDCISLRIWKKDESGTYRSWYA